MVTGSIGTGNGESDEIVRRPAPGMSKRMRMLLALTKLPASSSACRKEPGPLSFVFTTTSVVGGIVLTDGRQGENSDVLPFVSVAVAVMFRPAIGRGKLTMKLALLLASVVAVAEPR